MSAATATSPLHHLLASWRSLRGRELLWFVLIGLCFGAIDLSALLEIDIDARLPQVIARHLLIPLLSSLILLLVWLPAERSDVLNPRRNARLALATLIGASLSMVVIYALIPVLPWPSIYDLMQAKKGEQAIDTTLTWAGLVGDTLAVLMPAALMVATFELRQRHRRSQAAMQHLLTEQGQLRRRAMAARLATLQAQVEPQLLFDALVDIEKSYADDDGEAPVRMDRLIRHLRVALPRLRESGSTLEAEAELLDSYLAVLQDLQPTPTRFTATWPEALRASALPPMLLLPLLQRALRLAGQPPNLCSLKAAPLPQGLRIELGFDRPGLCGDDAELRALSERLRVLTGGSARLDCRTVDGATLFTLELQP